MDKEALKKSVYMNLRCVTQSCKGGVPFDRLEKDYKDLIGKPIPIYDLGYNSVELFLQSIPDVVRLKRNNEGRLFVEGVADASTAHIASLISRQKNSKIGKGTSKKPSLQIRKYSCHESWRSSASNSSGISKKDNKTSVSYPVKLKMPALSTSNTELLNCASIKADINTESLTEPQSFILQELKSMQQGTSPLSSSVSVNEETTKVSNEALVPLSNSATGTTSSKKTRAKKRRKMKKAAQVLIEMTGASLNKSRLSKKVRKAEELGMTTEEFLENLKESLNSSTGMVEQDSVENSDQLKLQPSLEMSKEKQKLKSLTLRNLWNVTFRFKDGVLLSSLPREYMDLYRTSIPYKDLGYSTLKKFILDIPDVIHLKEKNGVHYAEAVRDSISQASTLASQQKEMPSTSNESINCASQSGWETSSNSSSIASKTPPKPDLKAPIERWLENVPSVSSTRATIASIPQPSAAETKPVLPSFSQGTHFESESTATLTKLSSSTLKDPAKNSEQLSEEKQKLKSLTLRNLWNLLFCYKDGLLMYRLPREYMALFGTPLPYKDLGYLTLKAFLLDNPDVVRFKKGMEGIEFVEVARDTILKPSSLSPQHKEIPSTSNKSINCTSQSGWEASGNSSLNASKILPTTDLKVLKTSIKHSLEQIGHFQSVLSTSATIASIPQSPEIEAKPVLPSFSQSMPSDSVSSNDSNLPQFAYKPTLSSFPKIKHTIENAPFNGLLLMNILLYGDNSFMEILKRGILAFDGFPFSNDSEEWMQKQLLLSMLPANTLKECMKLLCIGCDSNNTQVLSYKLMEFLSSPGNALSGEGPC